jgi:hypothetical protein
MTLALLSALSPLYAPYQTLPFLSILTGIISPFTNYVTGDLTGAECKLSKAGLALVELDDRKMEGRLLWLFPPRIAKAL